MICSTKSSGKLSVAIRSVGIFAGLVGLLLVCLNPAFAQTPPPVSFAPPVNQNLASGTTWQYINPESVAVGDFNGDGHLDVAIAGYTNVNVMLGNGDGTLQAPVTLPNAPGAQAPTGIAVADVNGDGHLDLIVSNANATGGGGGVSVYLGNGDGTFQAPVNIIVGSQNAKFGSYPSAVVVGDFNGDGKPDLAVTDSDFGYEYILLGNGDGTFQTPVPYGAGTAEAAVVGDFNGDGKLDLAVADTVNGVSILLGNGDGTFQAAVNYAAGWNARSIAVGDFNGDGHLDLAVGDYGGASVNVLLGNGDGTFKTEVAYAAGTSPSSVAVGDFNGDGKPDLIVTDSDTGGSGCGASSIFLGNGDGTFQPATTVSGVCKLMSVAVGDFNGDGKPDLAVANISTAGVSILLNSTSTFPSATVTFNNRNTPVPAFGKSSLSAPMTVTAGGSNMVAFATVWVDEGSGAPGTKFNVTASYGGLTMTSAGPASYDYNYAPISTRVFYLVNPPTGTNTLVVNATASSGTIQEVVANLVSYNGVNQTIPVRPGTYQNQDSATGVTVSSFTAMLASNSNDLTLGAVEATYPFATPASNQSVDGTDADYFMVGSDHATTGASSVTDTWSFKNPWAYYAYVGFSIQAITSGGGTPTLTYTATPMSRTYGTNNPAFTGTVTGFTGTDTLANATTGTLGFVSPAGNESPVGSYAINGTGLTAIGGKYLFAQAPSNATALTITQATPTVTVTGGTFGYDGNPHGATATAVGFDGTTPVNGTFSFTYNPGGSTVPTTPGTYSVTANFTSSDPNYTNASGTGSIIITGVGSAATVTLNYRNAPAAAFNQTQLAAPMIVNYGANTVAFVTVWVDEGSGAPGTTFNVTATYGGQPMTSAGPAAYDYNYAPISTQVFYLVSPPPGANSLVINATASAGTIQEVAANLVAYDGVDLINPVRPGTYQTLNSANGASVSSFTANIASNPSDLTLGAVEATYTFATPASNQTVDGIAADYFKVGSDHATAGASSVSDTWSFTNPWAYYAYVGFSIQASTGGYTPVLTYTATPVSLTFGSPIPAFTGTVSGFTGMDTQANATTGTLTFATTATSTSGVGSYAINGAGLTANGGKYSFVQAASNAAALTITPATPTITFTIDTVGYSGQGGGCGPETVALGVNGNTPVSGTFTFVCTTLTGSPVVPTYPGTYNVTATFTSSDPNYSNATYTSTFTILPGLLTYKATPATRAYNTANPPFTGTVTGFVGNDTLANATTGTLTFTSPATTTSAIGSYPINGSGLTANNGAYIFSQASGNATALTITAPSSTIPVTLNNANAIAASFGSSTLNAPMNVTGGGTNTVAFAIVWVDEAAGSPQATFNVTATYGGQAMTSAGPTAYNYGYAPISAQVFYLVNPPTGSNTLAVSATASSGTIQEVAANLVSFNNVSQTAPVRPETYETVSGPNVPVGGFTATISSNANDLTLGAVEQTFHFATPPSNQTVDGTASAYFALGDDHSTTGAPSVSDSWNFTQLDAFYTYLGFSIQVAQ